MSRERNFISYQLSVISYQLSVKKNADLELLVLKSAFLFDILTVH